jgi:NitT/TauT family transport system substrate-binding protein
MRGRIICVIAAVLLALGPVSAPAHADDKITIGVVQSEGGASAYVAAAKGYFKEAGLDATLVQFPSAAPISVAAASGDIDFGSTALTAAFCNLASQGSLRIIASGGWERRGFKTIGFLVSNQAYDAGLHSFRDAAGHSVGITQPGTPLTFTLMRILKKYGVAETAVRIVPLQSNQNVASALKGGQVDIGIQTVANIEPLVARGDARALGWASEEVDPNESTVTFTTARNVKERPDVVRRFLAALAKGSATWSSAFIDAAGNRQDQPSAPEMIAIVAAALHEPPSVVANGISYVDPENRIVLSDLQDVLDWYAKNGMIKGHIDAAALIEERFAILAKSSE